MENVFIEFWIPLSLAVLAGIIPLFLQPNWWRSLKNAGRGDRTVENSGNYARVKDSVVQGDLNIHQNIDNRQQNTYINQNIRRSESYDSHTDDTVAKILLMVGVALATSIIFAFFYPFLSWITYGATAGLSLLCITAMTSASRIRAWSTKAVVTCSVALITPVTAFIVWTSINNYEQDGLSMSEVTSAVQTATAEAYDDGTGVVRAIFDYLVPAFFGVHSYVFMFVVMMLLAVISQIVLLFVAIRWVIQWRAYLSFADVSHHQERVTARAQGFQDLKTWRIIISASILFTVAILASQGMFYEMWLEQL